jgi:hypothetical protein
MDKLLDWRLLSRTCGFELHKCFSEGSANVTKDGRLFHPRTTISDVNIEREQDGI